MKAPHTTAPTDLVAQEALLRGREGGGGGLVNSQVLTEGTAVPTPAGAPFQLLPGQTQSYLLFATARSSDGDSANIIAQAFAKNVAGVITIETTGGIGSAPPPGVISDPGLNAGNVGGANISLTTGVNSVQLNVIGIAGVDIEWSTTVLAQPPAGLLI
jgi:hypothetical protein